MRVTSLKICVYCSQIVHKIIHENKSALTLLVLTDI